MYSHDRCRDQGCHPLRQNIVKTFLILALPIMFSSIIKTLHDMVDMYVVANIKDTKAIVDAQVAAISFTTPIISVVQGLAMGMMVAGTALMSQNIGAKRFIQAKRISGQLMLLCLIIGIIFNVLLYIMAPNIIRWMNAEEELFVYSVRYVRVRSFELSGFVYFLRLSGDKTIDGGYFITGYLQYYFDNYQHYPNHNLCFGSRF